MKSLTEQIEALMGEEGIQWMQEGNHPKDKKGFTVGFNKCRTEMINKIPEILSLIRVIIDEDKHLDDYGFQVINVDDLLEKLK